jgi:hypothetical protein
MSELESIARRRDAEDEAFDLDTLRALSESATSGPWRFWTEVAHPSFGHSLGPKDGGVASTLVRTTRSEEDARFIVAAVNYVRRLLATR